MLTCKPFWITMILVIKDAIVGNSIPLINYEWNVTCINRNARSNNNQLITYYLLVPYLLRIQQYPVNTTCNNIKILVYAAISRFSGLVVPVC